MGFGALTSFTGGGDLASSSTASADGDSFFTSGAFNYTGGNKNDNTTLLIAGAFMLAIAYMVTK